MNTSLMIELKNEYNIQLQHILTPIIFEGLQHLYNEAKKNSEKSNILKTFQTLLKRIPSWEFEILDKELNRIQMKTKNYPWLFNLIQAVFKINILIMDMEPSETLKNDINMGQFIHHIYIECAREFWMDPFLFYHDYSSFEQKKNYLEIMKKINCSIENAIRRLLPMGIILDKFLGVKTINGKEVDTTKLYNIPLLLDINLEPPKSQKGGANPNNDLQVALHAAMQPAMQPALHAALQPALHAALHAAIPTMPTNQYNGVTNDTLDKNINDQILNIINKNKVLTESNELINNFTVNNHSNNNSNNHSNNHSAVNIKQNSDNKRHSSSTLKKIINESIRNSHNSATRAQSGNSDVKNKILKELDSDTITYNPEENAENYQDIFSNSDIKHTINTNEKVEKKTREKFFNNYLNI